ncbi:MAG: short-chain fatty acyl-CoA regulator family protein [Pseudomonadota bacterium]
MALGCDLKHALRLVYADPFDLNEPSPVPIGPNCYLCERPNCAQRAHPPLDRRAHYDERNWAARTDNSLVRWARDLAHSNRTGRHKRDAAHVSGHSQGPQPTVARVA